MTTADALWQLVLDGREGILATVTGDGRPQLSNILYVADGDERVVRVSTTAQRAKARNIARDGRVALHVSGDNFWAYAVAEGRATLSGVAEIPGDDACRELLNVHSAFYGDLQPDAFYKEMIANKRLVIRVRLDHVYGIITTSGRRPRAVTPTS